VGPIEQPVVPRKEHLAHSKTLRGAVIGQLLEATVMPRAELCRIGF
jgi:hypothetical protein